MTDDLYIKLKALALELKNTGNDDVCSDINDAINFSSTATEILMKTRFYLSKINKETLSTEMSSKIDEIKSRIDCLLK